VPDDFTGESDWETLLMMERSCAIMCPTVGYHLAGTKKVQQELARPGVLERFISDKTSAQRIRETFAGQFSLDMVSIECLRSRMRWLRRCALGGGSPIQNAMA